MTREILKNGYIKLRSESGFTDDRFGTVHYTVICAPANEKHFHEIEKNL